MIVAIRPIVECRCAGVPADVAQLHRPDREYNVKLRLLRPDAGAAAAAADDAKDLTAVVTAAAVAAARLDGCCGGERDFLSRP